MSGYGRTINALKVRVMLDENSGKEAFRSRWFAWLGLNHLCDRTINCLMRVVTMVKAEACPDIKEIKTGYFMDAVMGREMALQVLVACHEKCSCMQTGSDPCKGLLRIKGTRCDGMFWLRVRY